MTAIDGTTHGVVFDLDGVIADSALAIGRCVDYALLEVGRPACPPERLGELIGPPLPVAFRTVVGPDASAAEIDELVAHYRVRYREASLVETRVFPGVADAVRAIARVAPLAIATTKPLRFAEPIVARLGLADAFVAVEGPGVGNDLETKGQTLERALRRLGDPPTAVMIGDRASDAIAAREHGAFAVGVGWGYGTTDELLHAGVDVLVDAPDRLASAVTALFGCDRAFPATEGEARRVH